MGSGALRTGEGQNQLRVQLQAARVDGGAELARNVDISETPHEAHVVALIGFDTVAAPILSRLAGGLSGSQRVHQLTRRGIEGRYADAHRNVHARLTVGSSQLLDALAQ